MKLCDVCEPISRSRPLPDDVNHLNETASAVSQRLPAIRVLFTLSSSLRLETLASYIDKLIKTGEYTSCSTLSDIGAALSFHYIESGKRHTPIDQSVLQDLVLGMRVFVTKQESKQRASDAESKKAALQQEAISKFLKVENLAKEIHSIHLALEHTGTLC